MLPSNNLMTFNMESSVLNKVLYGLSINESLDVTDRFKGYMLYKNNIIDNNIKKFLIFMMLLLLILKSISKTR